MITTDWNGGAKVEESIAEDIKKIADIKALKDHPNLLVFPYSFGEYDEGFGKNSICTFDEEEQKVVIIHFFFQLPYLQEYFGDADNVEYCLFSYTDMFGE